ncbi:hypothetical protein CRE_00029 [Caenorhabditis remanei]|uniref:Uncharacterized protein n=1 Tax=Caenorhabditis remanei TaxID=31234 RepID=E3LCI9_CAERE|nr:hypothetical protein CRE_00029 [Caenorhabditis remanei]
MINATPESVRKSLRVSQRSTPGEQFGEPRITRQRRHIVEKFVDNYVSKSPEPNELSVEQSVETPPEETQSKVEECPEPPGPLENIPVCSTTVPNHIAAQGTDKLVKKSKIVPKERKLNAKLEAINNKLSDCVTAPFSTPSNQGQPQTPPDETKPKVEECPEPLDPLENVPVCSTTVLNHIGAQVTDKLVKKSTIVPKRQKLNEKLEALNNKLSECVAAPFSTPDGLPIKRMPVSTDNEVAPPLLPVCSTTVLNHIAAQVTDKFVKKSLVNRERNLNEKLEALQYKLSECVATSSATPPNQEQSQNGNGEIKKESIETGKQGHIAAQVTDTFMKKSNNVNKEPKLSAKLEALQNKLSKCVATSLTAPPNQEQPQNGNEEIKKETVESGKQSSASKTILEKFSPAPGIAIADSAVRNSLLWVQEQNTQRVIEEQNRLLEYINIPLDPDAEPPRYKKFKKDNDEIEEEERRLDEEAAMTVAKIREAAVKRIIQTRTSGKTPTCVQVAAQDAEIAHYITATSDVSILNEMPEPTTKALPTKALKKRADISSSEDPISDSITDVVRKNILPVKQAPVHTNNVVAPPLLPHRPIGLPNRQLPRSLGPCSQSGQTLRLPIPQFRPRVPTIYQGSAHARPMLPVKVVMRPSAAAPTPSTSTVALKAPKEEPVEPTTMLKETKEVLVTPKSEINALSGLKKPKEEPVEEEEVTAPKTLPSHIISSDRKRLIPNHYNIPTAPMGANQRVVTNGTHIPSGTTTEKIFVTRGPDGKIVPTRRILIRRVPPQIQKVILAPPPGLNPRPHLPVNQFQTRNGFDVHHRNQGANNSHYTLPHVGNGNRDLASANQPNCETTLVKKEPIDVKEEPMEDYQQSYNLYDNTVNPYRTVQTGLFPVSVIPRPETNTSAMQPRMPGAFPPIIMPCRLDQETGKYRSVFEPAALQRGTSPTRVFLGAEEPIKDLPDDTKKFSWFTQRTVRNFNDAQLMPFRKRPAANYIEEICTNNNAREASAVLIEEVEPEKEETEEKAAEEEKEEEEVNMEIDEGDKEEIQRMVELKKARNQEFMRQKQALAQKLILNEYKICEYMQSETFKDLIKPAEDSSTFQKIVQAPAPLAKFPEFCESLSSSYPALFRNLTRIHHMQNNDLSKFVKDFGEVNERKKRVVFGPVQLTHGVSEMKKKDRLRNLSTGIIAMLEVVWCGVTTKVPEFIQCTLCGDIMRLCMRKCYYRGVLREYPAYRCLRKGCQTFHSIKKQFNLNIQNKISHWYAIPVPPKPSSKKKKGAYAGPTKFLIKAVEWKNDLASTPNPEPVENIKAETPEEDIEIRMEESPERFEEKPVVGTNLTSSPREKRIRKNKLDTLSKDFLCGTSAAEIARLDNEKEMEEKEEEEDEEDEDMDAAETVGFRFITDNSNLSGEMEEQKDEDDEDNEGDDDNEEEDSDYKDSSDKEDDDKEIVVSPTKALKEKPSPSPKKVETPPSRPVTNSRYGTRSSTRSSTRELRKNSK